MKPSATILIVEDDLDLRDSLQMLLESEGYRVQCAGDGGEAMTFLEGADQKPDLILLDWMMPRVDGSQFCVLRAQNPELLKIPVLILTADGNIEAKVAQSKASGGVNKPVDIEVLLAAIRRFL